MSGETAPAYGTVDYYAALLGFTGTSVDLLALDLITGAATSATGCPSDADRLAWIRAILTAAEQVQAERDAPAGGDR